MKRKTYLANAIDIADEKAKYDSEARKLISDRTILAWIIKYTVKELKSFSVERIASAIEGEPEVSEIPMHPGRKKPDAIIGMATDDKVPNEGEILYDIRFYVIVPGGERIKLILDVEIQKDYYPGYDLVTRAVFYSARMLSAQLNTEFTVDDYDDVNKVYSIWICVESPKYAADTITEYCMGVNNIFGNFTGTVRYDLQSIVVICLDENSWERKATALHGLLGTLFSDRLTPEQKEDILSKEYGIKMEIKIKEGMNQMCNLSDAIEERGIARGEKRKLIELVCRKLRKGKSFSVIVDELEEDEESLMDIYNEALKAAPDYDEDKVYKLLCKVSL